jgi:hypothetical protein
MIQAESDPQKRDEYLQRLMDLPNQVCLRSPPPPQFCERNLHRIKIAQGIILYRKKGLKVFLYFHNVTNNDGPYIYINEPLTKI